MRRRHWPTQQIHRVDWITSLELKPIEFKWITKKPESDCRASRYLKDNDKLKRYVTLIDTNQQTLSNMPF